MGKISKTTIESLIPDDRNFNTGTEYGSHLMEKSFRQFGAGRSILIDKNNRVIAGNKSLDTAAMVGIENVIIVETTGDEIVAVKRTDVDLDSKQGREMALADNATGKANLSWDDSTLQDVTQSLGISIEDWGINPPEWLEPEFVTDDPAEPGHKTDFTRPGDVWKLGPHLITVGESKDHYCQEMIETYISRGDASDVYLLRNGMEYPIEDIKAERS